MSGRLKEVQAVVERAMDDILANFKEGAKITVMVRRPGNPDQDFLMTNDDLPEVAAMAMRARIEAP